MDPSNSGCDVVEESSIFPRKAMTVSTKAAETEFLPFAVSWHAEVEFSEAEESDFKVKDYHASRLRCKSDTSTRNANKAGFQLPYPVLNPNARPGTVECRVRGHSFSGESSPFVTSSILLCVLDPDSRELEVLPFQDIFLHMKMEAEVTNRIESSLDPFTTPTRGTGISKFSSKAKRRRSQELTVASQKVKHNTEAVVALEEDKDITELLENAKEDQVDLLLGEGIRPIPQLAAKVPEDLYEWDNIVPKNVIDALKPVADEISESLEDSIEDWKKSNKFSPYVLKQFLSIPKACASGSERIALLVCIDYLFALFNRPLKPIHENALLPSGVPVEVRNYFSCTFTVPSHIRPKQRTISAKLKDKIMAHILLWILKSENYSADISKLMAGLRVKERAKVQQLATIIGARCSEKDGKDQSSYILTLKYPWSFPKGNRSPRKKRRN